MAFVLDPKAPSRPASGASQGPGTGLIKDSDTANFMADVIEPSAEVPVIVDFWAPWCGPCKQLGPVLEKLVTQAGGLVRLVKINIDENPDIAAQLRIQSIPSVFAFRGGQPVDAFQGALPESQVRQFIERLTGGAKAPIDTALDEAEAALDGGDVETAESIYAEVLARESANARATAGLIRAAVARGALKRARELASALSETLTTDTGVVAAIAALELAEQAGASGDVAQLAGLLALDGSDHGTRFDLAMAHYSAGGGEAAVDELLEIVRRDRSWNDEAARKQLVKIFESLGPTHPLTVSGRRRLSSILFS